jgi:hypothetical protein
MTSKANSTDYDFESEFDDYDFESEFDDYDFESEFDDYDFKLLVRASRRRFFGARNTRKNLSS